MDPRFDAIATNPWNAVFHVVFFPDRIYHAQYLNATRSTRYRYDVDEVRGAHDVTVLKGTVFMDGLPLSPFLRIEYRGGRLVEAVREKARFLRQQILASVAIRRPGEAESPEAYVWATVPMYYCPWVDAFQVELWENLEPRPGRRHDLAVSDMIGYGGSITRVPAFSELLKDVKAVRRLKLQFREAERQIPTGWTITDPARDDQYKRNIQVPNREQPFDLPGGNTTEQVDAYAIDFQRGWFVEDVSAIKPTVYSNPMMEPNNPDNRPGNHVDMRWVFQREMGSSLVFFHEVTLEKGMVEGTHQHIGSEELYYITAGTGEAYMGLNDDPALADKPTKTIHVFGLDPKEVRVLNVKPGSVIFTKSGGVHGIKNTGDVPLKFVAFLYHSN